MAGQPTAGNPIEAADFLNLSRLGFLDFPVPANPAAGQLWLFLDQATGVLSVRKDDSTTVSLELSRIKEDIAGTKDSVNTAFTISVAGATVDHVDVYKDGALLKRTVGYNLSGTTLTALSGFIPDASAVYQAIIYT